VRRHRDETYWGRTVPGFGDARARLLVVGLAPAAHGANRTGRMFTGDASGDWLYEALYRFGFASQSTSTYRTDGLQLTDCFVTAAARCAPPSNKPTTAELAACREYLDLELRALRTVRVVVTLGRIGHTAWVRAALPDVRPAERPPFGHARTTTLADGLTVIASYHPSRQNTQTGRLTRTMWHDVFRRARRMVDR